ncbi:hypothetical protein CENDO_00940 [Corynebacterium endometrii]|uniref:Uncharacterized protein n=2 Tax=Corynebacterium endometrii TaxID=2488819 RepID=A0A4P7QD33_9CORY|nr:hypothetical protein CENDO_00940 [Corynebacterium endometrii]
MAIKTRVTVTALIAALTVSFTVPVASATPVHSNTQTMEQDSLQVEDSFDDSIPDEVMLTAIEEASEEFPDPTADPEGYERAITHSVQRQMGHNEGVAPRIAPAVIIGARIAMCAASAYPSLAALDGNAGYAHNAGLMGNILASCIGGGLAGPTVAKWIMKNPRIFGGILNSIGLGHLAADSAQ